MNNPNWLSYFSEGLKPSTSIVCSIHEHSRIWQSWICPGISIIVCTSLLIFSRDTRAVEVCFLASCEKLTMLDEDMINGKATKTVKQTLAPKVAVPRFRQRLFLEGGWCWDFRTTCLLRLRADLFGDLGVSTGCWGIETAQLASSSQDLPIDFPSSSCWRWSGAVGGFSASCRPMTRRGEAQYLKLLKLLVLGNI